MRAVHRPHAVPLAIATCAAAADLAGSGPGSADHVSLDAAAHLGRQAVIDTAAGAGMAGRPVRARRLLARAGRRLRFAHAMTVELQRAGHTVGVVGVFGDAAGQCARRLAVLCCTHAAARVHGPASRELRRAARLQDDVALGLARVRPGAAPAPLREELERTIAAHEALLAALAAAGASPHLTRRRRRRTLAALAASTAAHAVLGAAHARVPASLPGGEGPAEADASRRASR
jgi:hypothetical protein